ncbi:hypothetical protein FPZ12_005800 [Amycolatopsis acidicola]|uniref:Uncharacterized protein n=1 Tax=Amycolatopsis acidicola TaxID=2596893 RepID=A0A5N0VGV3_9PSEU|nr:hypothetical protein [Amycolatopsis acidicola]KAA9165579.1 hypothetical protein FPZ12_005800 [Amycolatopsis acidicola]
MPHAPALNAVRLLIACYVGLSLLTLVAIFLLYNDSAMVNDAVLVRGTIVALTSFLTLAFAVQTARGSSRGYLRLRITSAILFVAIVVILALPGTFTLWFKLEQGVCGLLLLGVVLLVNSRRMRSFFGARG